MKYKVLNNNGFAVGIRFENEANREITIKPKSFVMMAEDDILYVDAVSKLFRNGVVYIEDEELMIKMGYMEKNPNSVSDDEIRAILKAPNPKLKKELEKIESKHAIDKVISLAKELDLPQSKLKLIKDQFGVEIFEELDTEIV